MSDITGWMRRRLAGKVYGVEEEKAICDWIRLRRQWVMRKYEKVQRTGI